MSGFLLSGEFFLSGKRGKRQKIFLPPSSSVSLKGSLKLCESDSFPRESEIILQIALRKLIKYDQSVSLKEKNNKLTHKSKSNRLLCDFNATFP